jgi:hypothetical protein
VESINWSAVQAVTEVLGLIFVVGSLIFVGLQMRQTAIAIKLNANHSVQEAFRDSVMRLADNQELASIFHREIPKAGSVEGVEEFRFALFNQAILQMYGDAFFQHNVGALDRNTWNSIDAQLGNWLKTPGMRGYWKTRGSNFPRGFENHINNTVMQTPQQETYRTAGT